MAFELFPYVYVIPFPLAPLQPIKQHERGVVVITKPPRALQFRDMQLVTASSLLEAPQIDRNGSHCKKNLQGRRISHLLSQC